MKIYVLEHEYTLEHQYEYIDRFYALSLSEINQKKEELYSRYPKDTIDIDKCDFEEIKELMTIDDLEHLLGITLTINDNEELQINKE